MFTLQEVEQIFTETMLKVLKLEKCKIFDYEKDVTKLKTKLIKFKTNTF